MDCLVFAVWMMFGNPTVVMERTGFDDIGLTSRKEGLDLNWSLMIVGQCVC